MARRLTRQELGSLAESQVVEFKKSLSLTKEGLIALNAMVNADGGKGLVLFGVEDDGTPYGIEHGNHDKAQRSLVQHVQQKFDPRLLELNVELLDCEGNLLLAASARRGKEIPYHEYDGRAYIREGTSKRVLTVDEKQRLVRRRRRDQHNGPWRCDRCGAWVGQFVSYAQTESGMERRYDCECGGEYWPET